MLGPGEKKEVPAFGFGARKTPRNPFRGDTGGGERDLSSSQKKPSVFSPERDYAKEERRRGTSLLCLFNWGESSKNGKTCSKESLIKGEAYCRSHRGRRQQKDSPPPKGRRSTRKGNLGLGGRRGRLGRKSREALFSYERGCLRRGEERPTNPVCERET